MPIIFHFVYWGVMLYFAYCVFTRKRDVELDEIRDKCTVEVKAICEKSWQDEEDYSYKHNLWKFEYNGSTCYATTTTSFGHTYSEVNEERVLKINPDDLSMCVPVINALDKKRKLKLCMSIIGFIWAFWTIFFGAMCLGYYFC